MKMLRTCSRQITLIENNMTRESNLEFTVNVILFLETRARLWHCLPRAQLKRKYMVGSRFFGQYNSWKKGDGGYPENGRFRPTKKMRLVIDNTSKKCR